jgi:Family of unknown function (DUF6220)
VKALRTIYRVWAGLLFVAVLVQIGFAGYGAFFTSSVLKDKGDTLGHESFDHAWRFHTGFGYVVVYATVILLLLGLLARLGRPRIWWPFALAVAGVVQMFLAYLGESHAKAGFLHPLDALVIFTLSGLIAHRAWRSPAP